MTATAAATAGGSGRANWWRMAVAVLLVGALTAAAGIALLWVLRMVQHLTFGYWEGDFLAGVQRAHPARKAIGMTVAGLAVGVGWWQLRRHVSTSDVSVTHALRDPQGQLPVLPSLADAVLQIAGVGAGASLGREGAARQAAAALGGWIAGVLKVGSPNRRILIACGAGAGLAAIYNVPISGMLYTLEVLLAFTSLRAVIPAILTSAIATALCWPVLANEPTYHLAPVPFEIPVLICALLLGPIAGVAGAGFLRLMTAARTRPPRGAWLIAGTTLTFGVLGAVGIAVPEILGNGKSMAEFLFAGGAGLGLVALLFMLKPLVTGMSLRGGAIGGLLTPSFATGAALGVAGHLLFERIWPGAPLTAYAIVGAAAFLSVTQRAPLTSIALAIEFTRAGLASLPAITVAVGLATVTAWLVDRGLTPLPLAVRRR